MTNNIIVHLYKCLDVYKYIYRTTDNTNNNISRHTDMSIVRHKVNIYSVMSQKGGAGKTTLAINLAVQSKLQGNID